MIPWRFNFYNEAEVLPWGTHPRIHLTGSLNESNGTYISVNTDASYKSLAYLTLLDIRKASSYVPPIFYSFQKFYLHKVSELP